MSGEDSVTNASWERFFFFFSFSVTANGEKLLTTYFVHLTPLVFGDPGIHPTSPPSKAGSDRRALPHTTDELFQKFQFLFHNLTEVIRIVLLYLKMQKGEFA